MYAVDDKENKKPGSDTSLTKREKDVLLLICEEKSTKQIAAALRRSPHTVESHKKSIRLKTGSLTVVGIVVFAMKNNIFLLLALALMVFYFFTTSFCESSLPDWLFD
jgi:DNA-binding CsgD family transcriptional regulator